MSPPYPAATDLPAPLSTAVSTLSAPVPPALPPTGQEIVFVVLAAVAVGSALLVVTTRQLVHAALWLVVSFGALAGGYLVLTAEFVAWVQVLIYVGAVVVLLLFGIMLTRAPIGPAADLDSGNRIAAAVVAIVTAGTLLTVVVRGFGTGYIRLEAGGGAADELGESVFRAWVLPFEVLSVLLVAALIGAIVLSRTDIGGRSGTDRDRPGTGGGPPGAGAGRAATDAGGGEASASRDDGDGAAERRTGHGREGA
jgi:NADH-quinone oxidoreductase subunit J